MIAYFINVKIASPGKCTFEDIKINVDTSGLGASVPARLAIRPEDVQLHLPDASDDSNQMQGTVESLEYLGAFVRATVKLQSGEARVQADLSTGDVHRLTLAPEVSVPVTLPADKLRLYPLDS